MTTIVYRDGIMAADTAASTGGWITSAGVNKLRRLETGNGVILAGISGIASLGHRYLDWMDAGSLGEPPSLECSKGDGNTFLLLATRDDGGNVTLARIEGDDGIVHYEDPFHALGSGTPAALAAMHMKATAIEAVQIAMLIDPYTAGSVNAISFD